VKSKSVTTRVTKVKKLDAIFVNGIAKLELNFVKGRSDTNLTFTDSSAVFKKLIVKNWNDSIVKVLELQHEYLEYDFEPGLGEPDYRLALKKVLIKDGTETGSNFYEFF